MFCHPQSFQILLLLSLTLLTPDSSSDCFVSHDSLDLHIIPVLSYSHDSHVSLDHTVVSSNKASDKTISGSQDHNN